MSWSIDEDAERCAGESGSTTFRRDGLALMDLHGEKVKTMEIPGESIYTWRPYLYKDPNEFSI
jgi:hypothetical protein